MSRRPTPRKAAGATCAFFIQLCDRWEGPFRKIQKGLILVRHQLLSLKPTCVDGNKTHASLVAPQIPFHLGRNFWLNQSRSLRLLQLDTSPLVYLRVHNLLMHFSWAACLDAKRNIAKTLRAPQKLNTPYHSTLVI